jgi:hypothetical protein
MELITCVCVYAYCKYITTVAGIQLKIRHNSLVYMTYFSTNFTYIIYFQSAVEVWNY